MKKQDKKQECHIGRTLRLLRKRKKINQNMLCEGICSLAKLSRIENGAENPDKMLLDALLQRLGKSPDKYETLLTEEDYIKMLEMEKIEAAIRVESEEYIKQLLKEYAQHDSRNNLTKQYVKKIEGMLAFYYEGDRDKSLKLFYEALCITGKNSGNLREETKLFTNDEIQLLVLLSQVYDSKEVSADNVQMSTEILKFASEVIDKQYTDDEEKVKVYPKVLYYLAKKYTENGNYGNARGLLEKAIALLSENRVIIGLPDLLERYAEVLCKLSDNAESGLKQQAQKALLQAKTIQDIVEEFGDKNQAASVFSTNRQKECLLIHEVIRNARLEKGIKQVELCQGICEPETLSRIEMGKENPSKQNYRQISERLDLSREWNSSFIDTEDFELFELKKEMEGLIALKKFDEAQQIYNKLTRKLDISKIRNEQYLGLIDTILKRRRGEIKNFEAEKRMTELLKLTWHSGLNASDKRDLSRHEVYILNNIAMLKKAQGDIDKAIDISKSVISNFCRSKYGFKKRYMSIAVIIKNLTSHLEENDQFDEALELCLIGLAFEIECGRCGQISKYLANYAFTIERKTKENGENIPKGRCLHYFIQAMILAELIGDYSTYNSVKKYCISKYDYEENSSSSTTPFV